MKQGATRLRKVPETAEELAEMPARASPDVAVASRAIPIDLRPVISAYRKRGRFMLRIEKLPQLARFSAGQNNGDGSWSLLLDELEDLIYFAPKSISGDHTLAIRLISKDETEAFTIALIDFTVRGEDTGKPEPGSRAGMPAPLPDDVRDELHQLKAALEARESELAQLRGSAERMSVMLQQKLDATVADAQGAWKREEASRLEAQRVRLEEQFEHRLAEREMRAQALAEIAREQQASALRLLRQEFAATKEALAARDSEIAAARAQLDRLRKDWEAEIESTKAAMQAKAAEALKGAEAAWRARADKKTAELEAAHGAQLAAADAARVRSDGELSDLRAELEQLRHQSQTELTSAAARLEVSAAEQLKKAETDWQARADAALAALTARCEAAEAALADARASLARSDRDGEVAELHAQLERQRAQSEERLASARKETEAKAAEAMKAAQAEWQARMDKALAEARPSDLRVDREGELARLRALLETQRAQSQAEIAAIRNESEAQAAKVLKAAQAQWQAESDRTQAALTARCEVAEAALRDAAPKPTQDAEIQSLREQLDHLQKQSQAEIAAIKMAAETKEAQMLKAAEKEWQARSDAALATVSARCEAAEAALADADGPAAERDAEIQHLRAEIERQGQLTETDIAAVKAAAEAEAEERLKMAQARWEKTAAAALADTVARCEAAEAALGAARRAGGRADDDEYVHTLEREIKTLRATLVDREAAIANAQAMQEHVRLGTVREAPGRNWQPLSSQSAPEEVQLSEKDIANRKLLRDIGVVVAVAIAAVLLLPKLEAMLPDTVRWQIETVGGLFPPAETEAAPARAPAVAVASTQPKAAHPVMYAARSINVREQPSTGAPVAANLKRGAAVAILETRGSWDRVEVSGPPSQGKQGWVFSSYLVDSDPAASASSPASPASPPAPGNSQAAPTGPVPSSASPVAALPAAAAPEAAATAPSDAAAPSP